MAGQGVIAGVDPGTRDSAIVVLDLPQMRVLAHHTYPNEEAARGIGALGLEGVPLAIEWITGQGMRVGQEVFQTCRWVGIFQDRYRAASRRPAPPWGAVDGSGVWPQLVPARDVRLFLTGTTRAGDTEIRAALIEWFGPTEAEAVGRKAAPGPLYKVNNHERRALAVAFTYGRHLAGAADLWGADGRPAL